MEPWIEEAAHPRCAPPGFVDWARPFATALDAWESCPRAEWRLWLAAYLAETPAEQLLCARAAFLVARRTMMLSASLPAEARAALASAEQWAVTRQTDDRHFDLLEEIRAWTGSPLAELGSLTNTAAWFADFEACVGIDAACNAMDLFAEAAALARLLADEDTIDQLLRELNEELFVLLRPVVAAAHGRVT